MNLALDLTVEQISLLEQHAGRWHRLGGANFDARNLTAQLQHLRDIALSKAGADDSGQPAVLAILPAEQVLYGSIPGIEGDLHPEHLVTLLEGQTPFPLSALRIDWRKRHGALQFAALPIETLKEAEDFLNGHGFTCAGVMSGKSDDDFDGAPWFGRSADTVTYSMAPEISGKTIVPIDRRKILAHPPVPAAPVTVTTPATGVSRETLERLAKATRMDPSHQSILADPDFDLDPHATKDAAAISTPHTNLLASRTVRHVGLLTAALVAGLVAVAFWPRSTPDISDQSVEIIRSTPLDATQTEIAQPEDVVKAETTTENAPEGLPVIAASISPEEVAAVNRTSPAEAIQSSLPSSPNLVSDQATFYTPASVAFRSTQMQSLDSLIQPAIDPEQGTDPLALNDVFLPETADFPASLAAPPPPDVTFAVDDRGLVRPSSGGQETPEGFLVYSGTPGSAPPDRPEFVLVEPPAPAPLSQAELAEDDPMRGIFPKPRPEGLAERYERASLGGRTEAELSRLRPKGRPASVDEAFALQRAAASAAKALTTTEELRQVTGPRPKVRPNDMARRYAATKTAPKATKARVAPAKATAAASTAAVQSTSAAASVTVPKNASKASVTERATISRAMNLARINLLGTFGSNSSPRALVRMPSGRVVSISVGDKLDGGRVASIGGGRLSYVKSGKTVTLSMPKG